MNRQPQPAAKPARPKFPPLYKARTDFNKELEKSVEDL